MPDTGVPDLSDHGMQEPASQAVRTLDYADGVITMIDQTALPQDEIWLQIDNVADLVAAIKRLSVRGAPAIGATAAFGLALASRQYAGTSRDALITYLKEAGDILNAARPTAVNLAWAVERLLTVAQDDAHADVNAIREALLKEAQTLADEDIALNRRMGFNGAAFLSAVGSGMQPNNPWV